MQNGKIGLRAENDVEGRASSVNEWVADVEHCLARSCCEEVKLSTTHKNTCRTY